MVVLRTIGRELAVIIFGFCLLYTLSAGAQSSGVKPGPQGEKLLKEYDRAFRAMMADPGNLDKTFTFAKLAIVKGDYEGAIGALERMLLINPNLPRVRLELGVLYFRLGSYQTARNYLATAIESPTVPPKVRKRAKTFIAEIDRRLSRHRLSGSVSAGMRYQTNATADPSTTTVRLLGTEVELDNQFTAQSDWNGFVIVSLEYLYDFKTVHGEMFEATALLYGARQVTQSEVNLGIAELTAGPRMALIPNLVSHLTVRPYGIFTFVALDDARYYWAPGGGFELSKLFGKNTLAKLNFEARDRRFNNTGESPTNTTMTGRELLVQITVQQRITDRLTALVEFVFVDQNANSPSEANRQIAGTVALSYIFLPPLIPASRPWSTVASITRTHINYSAPDPIVDPITKRRDRDWRLAVTTTIPVRRDLEVNIAVAHTMRSSSLPNFEFKNTSASVGVTWRF